MGVVVGCFFVKNKCEKGWRDGWMDLFFEFRLLLDHDEFILELFWSRRSLLDFVEVKRDGWIMMTSWMHVSCVLDYVSNSRFLFTRFVV